MIPARDRQPDARLERLTARQRDVAELLAKGLTNEDIGGVLGIGVATVKTHVASVLTTLEVANRTEAAGVMNAYDPGSAPSFATRPAIAVLAFEPLGFEPEAGRVFARGFADDLVDRLCRWRWFPVIARASGLATAIEDDVIACGRRLNARFLVHGSVRAAGSRHRVSAFVDDASDGTCLWSSHVDAHGDEVLALQATLAEGVVAAIYPSMIGAEVSRARSQRGKALPEAAALLGQIPRLGLPR